jgi:hypothetical protein
LAQCPSGNQIVDAGAESLPGVLGQCSALTRLKLGGNWIGDKGAGRLSKVLPQCTLLAHLNLSGNRIGMPNRISKAGAKRLTESWRGPEGGLKVDSSGLLDSEESEKCGAEESDDEESDFVDEEDADEGEDEEEQEED